MQGNEPKKRKGPGRQATYVGAIVINIILLYIVNNLLAWEVPILTSSFTACLWVINPALAATVMANAAFLVYDPAWFRHLFQMGLSILSFAAIMTLYVIFPFDFGAGNWEPLARVLLVLAMVGNGIGFLVAAARLIARRRD